MAKMSIVGDSFKDLARAIDEAGGDLKAAADEALRDTGKLVQSNLVSAAQPYAGKGKKGYATGEMYRAIKRTFSPVWAGDVAEVGVGFDLYAKGGFHSIFIMYGTPRISKDQAVFNAIKGTKIRKRIADAQKKIMQKHLKLNGGK